MEFLSAFSHLDWPLVLHLTWQHITLVGIAVTLAILVGVPLGILMTRFPTLAGPLQASATVLLTVPSIALFGLLLPFYSKFGQQHRGAGLQRAGEGREACHQDAQRHADQNRQGHGDTDEGDVLPGQLQDQRPVEMGKGVQKFHVFSSLIQRMLAQEIGGNG